MKKLIAVFLVAAYLSQSWAFAAPSRLFQRRAAAFETLPGSSIEEINESLDKSLGRNARRQWLEDLSQRKINPGQDRTDQPENTIQTRQSLLSLTNPEDLLPVQDVQIVTTDKFHEITNGLTGVRIAKQESFNPTNPSFTLAPLQAVRQADGTWSSSRTSYLTSTTPPKSMKVTFLENTPEKVVVEVAYFFDRLPLKDGNQTYLGGEAGEGYHKTTFTVYKGSQVMTILESGNYEVSYSFEFSGGLNPDQARYRGHHADSVEQGREPSGIKYRPNHERLAMDATVDLEYDSPKQFPKLAVWDPWVANGGYYWQFYDKDAPGTANLFGIFAGHPSKAIGAGGHNGVNPYTQPGGITELKSACGGNGDCHYVWQAGDELWYMKKDVSGQTSAPALLAQGFINPNITTEKDSILVTAFDPLTNKFFVVQKDANGSWQNHLIELSGDLKVLQPWVYTAYSSPNNAQYLLTYGQYAGKTGLLLFAKGIGESTYTYRDLAKTVENGDLPAVQSRKPVFTTLNDGRVVLVYTDSGGSVNYAVIEDQRGQIKFSASAATDELYFKYAILNFGVAIDSRTGDIVAMDSDGSISLLKAEGGRLAAERIKTSLNVPLDHHGQGPNNRSLAMDDRGNGIAFHNDEFFLFRADQQKWEKFFGADQLNLDSPVVSFNVSTQEFNIVGRYQGELANFVYKIGDLTPRLVKRFEGTERSIAGIKMYQARLNPDSTVYPLVQFEWNIFTATKNKGLLDPLSVQPINLAMNRYSGLADGRLDRYYSADYPDSGWDLFMPKESFDKLVQRVKTDTGFYKHLYDAEPSARDLLDMWRDSTGAKRKEVVRTILKLASDLKEALKNGNGIYDFRLHYWQGGLEMQRAGVKIAVLLADPQTSAVDKELLKEAAAGFGGVLWDNDFVPLYEGNGLNMGTANMPVQYQGYRDFYALLLSNHPDFKNRAKEVADRTLKTLHEVINEYGAGRASTNYLSPTVEPLLLNALQLKQRGIVDLFKSDDRLKKFAEFYLNLLATDVRYGGLMKLIANGDGSMQSSEIYGILAAGFRDVDPELSARLMGAWVAGGKRHSLFFGTTILSIDEGLPSKVLGLGDANFPGYDSVLRNDETALWFLNGDFYRDHAHKAEKGSLAAIYFDGAPLSVSWSSTYSPYYDNPAMHNVVFPVSMIDWSKTEVPLTVADYPNITSEPGDFFSFEDSASSTALFKFNNSTTRWTRSVSSFRGDESQPILYIHDDVTGTQPMIFSMNLMAKGAVETPSGSITPPSRMNPALPSLGPSVNLAPGVNKLGFTGQWGIDFDVITVSDEAQEAKIGSWGHTESPLQEKAEFKKTTGREFKEEQYTLRIKGNTGFKVFLLPTKKGAKPADRQVTKEGNELVVRTGSEETRIDLDGSYYSYKNTQTGESSLAAYTDVPAALNGIEISGGSAEVSLSPSQATVKLDGKSGIRKIKFPGQWTIDQKAYPMLSYASQDNTWTVDYKEGEPLTLTFQAPNLPPALGGISNQTLDEAKLIQFKATVTDQNQGQTHTFTLENAPEGATIDPKTGDFSWTPTESQGPKDYTITVKVTDSGNPPLTDSKTFMISVKEVNSLPVITPIPDQTVKEGEELTLAIQAQDTDLPAQGLTFSLKESQGTPQPLSSEFTKPEINPQTGLLRWKPSPGQAGTYPVTVLVYDGSGTSEQTFRVNVTSSNLPPALTPISGQATNEGIPVRFQATVSDENQAQTHTFTLENAPEGAQIDPTTGEFTWTPTESQGPGDYTLTLKVTDNGIPPLTDAKTFLISVGEINSLPVITPIPDQTVKEGEELTLTVQARDSDIPSQALAFGLKESQGSPRPEFTKPEINSQTGVIRWTPSPGQAGTYSFTVLVTDGSETSEQTFKVNVGSSNLAPALGAITDQIASEGKPIAFKATISDENAAQTHTFTLENAPEGAQIDPQTGEFTWTPTESQGPGDYTLTLKVTDNGIPPLTDAKTFLISVGEINSLPVITPIPDQTVKEGEELTLTVQARDSDIPSQALAFGLKESQGSPRPEFTKPEINSQTGVIRWTPSPGQAGTYSFTVLVTDEAEGISEQTFQVTVQQVERFRKEFHESGNLKSLLNLATGDLEGFFDENFYGADPAGYGRGRVSMQLQSDGSESRYPEYFPGTDKVKTKKSYQNGVMLAKHQYTPGGSVLRETRFFAEQEGRVESVRSFSYFSSGPAGQEKKRTESIAEYELKPDGSGAQKVRQRQVKYERDGSVFKDTERLWTYHSNGQVASVQTKEVNHDSNDFSHTKLTYDPSGFLTRIETFDRDGRLASSMYFLPD